MFDNMFDLGGGDSAKAESASFSLFSTSDNDQSSGFSFNFGNNGSNKQEDQTRSPEDGNLLSMFGNDGNQNKDSSNKDFSLGLNDDDGDLFSFFS